MQHVLIAGAGKIGTLIACLLSSTLDYKVHIVDIHFHQNDIQRLKQRQPNLHTEILNIQNEKVLREFVKKYKIQTVISSLPYFANQDMAKTAAHLNLNYFDLTEDVTVTEIVKKLAKKTQTAFVPQCGLAPGFISIAANSLMKKFDSLDTVKLRVGALPQNPSNALQYALTWSTDGLINEYGNMGHAIVKGEFKNVFPLEGLEQIQIEGRMYEAFNTSGGLGSLAEIYRGRVREMNYKTIRYPGHCEKMYFLMHDLKLNEDREVLKRILEKAIPKTYQDVILVYISVSGQQQHHFLQESFVKSIYPKEIEGLTWTGIQIATAAGMCGVVDLILQSKKPYKGLVLQEQISLDAFLANRFGKYYL